MNKFFTNIKKATVFDKLKNRSFKDALSTLLLLLPYAILFSIFIAIPVAVAIFLSFTNFNAVESPAFVGLQNYIALFTQDEVFLKYVLPNTLKYALIVGPGGYVLSFLVAWMLAQIQSVPRTILSLIMYAPIKFEKTNAMATEATAAKVHFNISFTVLFIFTFFNDIIFHPYTARVWDCWDMH